MDRKPIGNYNDILGLLKETTQVATDTTFDFAGVSITYKKGKGWFDAGGNKITVNEVKGILKRQA